MAGFEVTPYGRFCLTPEDLSKRALSTMQFYGNNSLRRCVQRRRQNLLVLR